MDTPAARAQQHAVRRATGQAIAGIFTAVLFVLAVVVCCGVLPAIAIAHL